MSTIKRRVRRDYDKTAQTYNILYSGEQFEKYKHVIKTLPIPSDSLILDCGCGTGLIESNVELPSNSHIVGLDLSARMLEIARSSVRKHNVHWLLGDVDHLPFRESCFQLVVCITVLQNLPSPTTAIFSIKHVLMPDGTLVLTGLKKKFRTQDIRKLVENAGFGVMATHEHPQVKDVILVCHVEKRKENA